MSRIVYLELWDLNDPVETSDIEAVEEREKTFASEGRTFPDAYEAVIHLLREELTPAELAHLRLTILPNIMRERSQPIHQGEQR